MEKRIAGIIRWLERCLEAHKAGEMESALMDVECARADMDLLRDGFWSKLDRRAAGRRRTFVAALFAALLKTALGATAVILATAAPLALPREKLGEEAAAAPGRVIFVAKAQNGLFETAAEREGARAAETEFSPPKIAAAVRADAKRPEPKDRPLQSQAQSQSPQEQPYRAGRDEKERGVNLSYENILALIQTGERALKNAAPAIEIEGVNRRGF
ncbi:MAG: hypothetical protein LBO82_05240 [Synergistaceae bacterium]|jgi:hypothetical protein|nr:hypothetical protein [Synergistaceae bacterium]